MTQVETGTTSSPTGWSTRRAQAQPARARARSRRRAAAGRAPGRRRGGGPRRATTRSHASVAASSTRSAPSCRRGQAAARLLRGARLRRCSRALRRVCAYAREAGLLVIADAKRGDIGSTARAYAAAYLEPRDESRRSRMRSPSTPTSAASRSSLSSRRAALHGAGIFVSCKTSNAGAPTCRSSGSRDGEPSGSTSRELVARVGRGPRRRARPVECRRRRRRDRSTRSRRGQAALPHRCSCSRASARRAQPRPSREARWRVCVCVAWLRRHRRR